MFDILSIPGTAELLSEHAGDGEYHSLGVTGRTEPDPGAPGRTKLVVERIRIDDKCFEMCADTIEGEAKWVPCSD